MPNPFIPILNSYLPEPQASLLNGILFGVKADMPRDFYKALVTTGVLHVIALSGLNISILINLIGKISICINKRVSIPITICLVATFVLFVGPSPSVVRAAIMGSLSLLAVFFGRQNWGLLSLLLACGVMLLFDLSLIRNISFQLSFLSTLGIILAGRRGECQSKKGALNQLIYWVRENLRLTLAAQLFTLPVILYNFHRVSLVAPITNLVVEWVVQPIMVLGMAASLLGWIWWPLGLVPSWAAWVPLTYFVAAVEWLGKVPGASVTF